MVEPSPPWHWRTLRDRLRAGRRRTPAGGVRAWLRRGAQLAAAAAVGAGLWWWSGTPTPGFDSPSGIATILADLGLGCADLRVETSRATCTADGSPVTISTFRSRPEVEAYWDPEVARSPDNTAVVMVIGDRWVISGPAESYLRQASTALGAELRTN